MGDFAKGIKSFKKGLSEDEETAAKAAEPAKTLDHSANTVAETTPESRKVG